MSAPVPPTAPVQPPATPAAAPMITMPSGTILGSFMSNITVTGVLISILLSLPSIIFSYGAAKVNWSINQSYFWSVIAFIFSGFYYPYYAYFQLPARGVVSSALQAVGARRRR